MCVHGGVCIFPVVATHTQNLFFPDLISSSPNIDFLCVVFYDLVCRLSFFVYLFKINVVLLKRPGIDGPEGRMLLFIHGKGTLPEAAAHSNLEGTTAEQVEMLRFKICYHSGIQPTKATDKMIHY